MYMYVHVYKDVCIYTIYYISNILNYIYLYQLHIYLSKIISIELFKAQLGDDDHRYYKDDLVFGCLLSLCHVG